MTSFVVTAVATSFVIKAVKTSFVITAAMTSYCHNKAQQEKYTNISFVNCNQREQGI